MQCYSCERHRLCMRCNIMGPVDCYRHGTDKTKNAHKCQLCTPCALKLKFIHTNPYNAHYRDKSRVYRPRYSSIVHHCTGCATVKCTLCPGESIALCWVHNETVMDRLSRLTNICEACLSCGHHPRNNKIICLMNKYNLPLYIDDEGIARPLEDTIESRTMFLRAYPTLGEHILYPCGNKYIHRASKLIGLSYVIEE